MKPLERVVLGTADKSIEFSLPYQLAGIFLVFYTAILIPPVVHFYLIVPPFFFVSFFLFCRWTPDCVHSRVTLCIFPSPVHITQFNFPVSFRRFSGKLLNHFVSRLNKSFESPGFINRSGKACDNFCGILFWWLLIIRAGEK